MEPENNGYVTLYNENIVNADYINAAVMACETFRCDEVLEYTVDNGVIVEGIQMKDNILSVDTITENTSNHGIQVESILIQDNKICDVNDPTYFNQEFDSSNNRIRFNVGGGSVDIAYYSKATVVTDDIFADRIYEKTNSHGVELDSILIKDGLINDSNYSTGILHSDANGQITSSLVIDTDISSGGATNGMVLSADGVGGASWITSGSSLTLNDAYENEPGSGGAHIDINGTIGAIVLDNLTGDPDVGTTAFIISGSSGNSLYFDFDGSIGSTEWTGGGLIKASAVYGKTSCSKLVNSDVDNSANISYSKLNLNNSITNADLAGSIDDTKLNVISTSGKVANSSTTCTDNNIGSTIVCRDVNGDFSARNITASAFLGNASSSTSSTNSTYILINDSNASAFYYIPFTSGTGQNSLYINTTAPGPRIYPSLNLIEASTFAGVSTSADSIKLVNETSSSTDHYICFTTNTSSYWPVKVSSNMKYKPSTDTLTVTNIIASLSGNSTTSTTSTNSNNISITDTTTGSNHYLTFTSGTSSNQILRVDSTGLTYNPTSNQINCTTFSGDLNGTINTASTATTQTSTDNSTKISTTSFVQSVVGNLATLPQLIGSVSGIINASSGTAQRGLFSGASIGRSLGDVNNVSPTMIYIDNSTIPTVTGKTAKIYLESLLITNSVTLLTGSNTIIVALHKINSSGGTGGNTSYTLASSVCSITYTIPATSQVLRNVSSTITIPSTGLYIVTVTCSATVGANSCANITANVYIIYE